MKDKPKSLSQEISDLRLHRSDVRELANILKAGEGSLIIESDSHTFETADELLALPEPVECIELKRRDNPWVSVKISPWHMTVYASSDDLVSVGLVSRLVEFAKSRRAFFRRSWWPYLLGLLCGVLTFAWCGRVLASLIAYSGVSLTFEMILRWGPYKGAHIKFRREKSAPVHWRGAAWDLVKLVLGGVIGALLTLFVQRCQVSPPSTPRPPPAAVVSPTVDARTAR